MHVLPAAKSRGNVKKEGRHPPPRGWIRGACGGGRRGGEIARELFGRKVRASPESRTGQFNRTGDYVTQVELALAREGSGRVLRSVILRLLPRRVDRVVRIATKREESDGQHR